MSAPFSTEPIQYFSDLANQFVANTCSHNCDYTCKSNYGVHGRLTASKQWWYDNLQLSKLIMRVLEDGYVIPFVEEPPSCYLKNNASALNDSEFVVQAITALLEANSASECVDVPYCCNPLTVVVGKRKYWL